jgi:hypothetical protein
LRRRHVVLRLHVGLAGLLFIRHGHSPFFRGEQMREATYRLIGGDRDGETVSVPVGTSQYGEYRRRRVFVDKTVFLMAHESLTDRQAVRREFGPAPVRHISAVLTAIASILVLIVLVAGDALAAWWARIRPARQEYSGCEDCWPYI